jgi:hypothetical protein
MSASNHHFNSRDLVRSPVAGKVNRLSRRRFLKGLALGLTSMGVSWLVEACQPLKTALPTPTLTSTAPPTLLPTVPPSATASLTPEAATALSPNPTLAPGATISFSPTPTLTAGAITNVSTPSTTAVTQAVAQTIGPGRLARVGYDGVWQNGVLDPAALRKMLDASLANLTGLDDARQAWRSRFDPHERVVIKVNSIANGSTHVALVLAVAECLQDAGIPANQITVYDRTTEELANAGFPVSTRGDGLRCVGTDGQFAEGWKVGGVSVRLSRVLADCEAVINIPILKAFTYGGMSFAMKNHYGSVETPSLFHGSNFAPGITGLNALAPIRDRTRLIIGDILTQETYQDATSYTVVGGAKPALLMGTDAVAMDAIGLQMADVALSSSGADFRSVRSQATKWLQAGTTMGLGIGDATKVSINEISLD